ncbi:xanthine dehydrogenase family protein molybdopterin-binding subunit [Minwuia thermotolerans]|uniref:Carbon monoxide dehydrogenase n=1 Tax=Minwuia thermotolerans TaxID=2056226 RepID=A0A2M9G2B3_9PROT|nr:xanthine dehydrogenase family protein molybdopterin-binding subunit [Minwuia thermotolerans]PJK29861.1 carbon monoxide dehydrogenase [Minwuia thermotolerans]
MTDQGIGASVRRKEDLRFIKGRGKYTDDIVLQDMSYAAIVRSPHAHAKINRIDTSAARAAPGVVGVLTADDFAAFGGLPCGWQVTGKNEQPMIEPKHPILAEGKVRHVGDPVAVVIAESRAQARDAAELVEIDYEPLPAVVDMRSALEDGASVHDEAGDNLCYDWELGDREAVEAAFRKADHVTTLELINNRLVPNAMEPRCAIGDFDDASGEHTLYTSSQNPHVIRLLMGAFVLQIPEHKLRVYSPDVGGGFGSKIYHYAEEAIVTVAAKVLGRPVKWTSDRTEAFISDAHGRDHVTKVELAMDKEGRFLALREQTLANMGAYLSTFAPSIPTYLHATLLAGQYTTPAILAEVKAVFTNTVPVDAYRGAGRPEATYLLERVIDLAADEMGMDPVEIRRKNFIQPDQFPYATPVALTYDTGDYEATLTAALKAADWDGFEARREEAKRKGKLRGIGIACYIEACGIAPSNIAGALGARAGLYECATVRVNPTGSIQVMTGSHSHGQGHETTFAQVVADRLGIGLDQIDIVHGDTNKIPFGMGTYGSRSIAVGGAALSNACDKIVNKATKIAAHLMEASADDVVFENGSFKVTGTDKQVAFGDVALTAYVPHNYPLDELEPGLEETAFYDPKNFTFPAGTYVCEVEIEPQTGAVEIVSFHASDDFGNVINPMIVEGQVHGGLAQGIGQALLENTVYDNEGQLVSGTYMDYCMPRAYNFPNFTVDHQVTACTHNPLGVKGCGEAGAIGSPPAVINAIVDALKDYGVSHIDMPATPAKIWRIVNGGMAAAAE